MKTTADESHDKELDNVLVSILHLLLESKDDYQLETRKGRRLLNHLDHLTGHTRE